MLYCHSVQNYTFNYSPLKFTQMRTSCFRLGAIILLKYEIFQNILKLEKLE